jgi:inorganic pyrophosphatase
MDNKNYATKYLGKIVFVKIDRPLGSKHPKHNYYYPLNYGYIPDTKAPDGEEVDAYVLGFFKPLKDFTGKCIAVIQREKDDDDKLILIADNVDHDTNYTDDQIKALTQFQERFFKSKIIRVDK